jgi:hypothetical protein
MPGTGIASPLNVLRRITALLGMIGLIGLLLMLIWEVEMHHEHGSSTDEPAIVSVSSRVA